MLELVWQCDTYTKEVFLLDGSLYSNVMIVNGIRVTQSQHRVFPVQKQLRTVNYSKILDIA